MGETAQAVLMKSKFSNLIEAQDEADCRDLCAENR